MRKKIVRSLVAGFGLLAIIIGLYGTKLRLDIKSRAAGETASMILPTSKTVGLSQMFDVPIQLQTNAIVRAIDVVINFDNSKLNVVSVTPLAKNTAALPTYLPVLTNDTFNTTAVVNKANETGRIEFSAVGFDLQSGAFVGQVSGTLSLAQIRFSTKSIGGAFISIEYQPNSSIESNVVLEGNPPKDILSSVTNMQVTIVNASETPVPTVDPSKSRMTLTLLLHGIGKGGDNVNAASFGNMNPNRLRRTILLELFNSNNQPIGTRTGYISYFVNEGIFKGEVSMDGVPDGIYTGRLTIPQYLTRTIPGIITVNAGQSFNAGSMALVNGDANIDNRLSILDYNVLLDCFSDLAPAKNCADSSKRLMADLTDDGNVNQFDYNLFLRELSVQSGE